MAEINLLKTDNRGRVTLPTPFRKEPLFEYMIEGDQITLFPVRTVRKFPDLSNLPEEELSPQWLEKERRVNKDRRQGVVAAHPAEALKKLHR